MAKLVNNASSIYKKYMDKSLIRHGFDYCGLEERIFIIPKIGSKYYKCADVRYTFKDCPDTVYTILRAFVIDNDNVRECSLRVTREIISLYIQSEEYKEKDFICLCIKRYSKRIDANLVKYLEVFDEIYNTAIKSCCDEFYNKLQGWSVVLEDSKVFEDRVKIANKIYQDFVNAKYVEDEEDNSSMDKLMNAACAPAVNDSEKVTMPGVEERKEWTENHWISKIVIDNDSENTIIGFILNTGEVKSKMELINDILDFGLGVIGIREKHSMDSNYMAIGSDELRRPTLKFRLLNSSEKDLSDIYVKGCITKIDVYSDECDKVYADDKNRSIFDNVGVIDDIDNNSNIDFFSLAFQGKPIGTVLKK